MARLLRSYPSNIGLRFPRHAGTPAANAVYGSETAQKSSLSFSCAGFIPAAAFATLSLGWGGSGLVQAAAPANAVYGSEYQPRANHASWKTQPVNENPPFSAPTGLTGDFYQPRASHASWKTQPINDNGPRAIPAVAWGDNYQPRASHATWKRQSVLDNPPFPTTAVPGSDYLPRANHFSWRAQPINDSGPRAVPAILWGDNYSPRARHDTWKTQPTNDNPVYAFTPPSGLYPSETWGTNQFLNPFASAFNILGLGWGSVYVQPPAAPTAIVGDSYSPYAQFKAWSARAISDTPVFPTTAVYGSEYLPRAQHASWRATLAVDNPPLPTTAVLGDGYRPELQVARRLQWQARLTNDNPVFAQFVAVPGQITGDLFQIRRKFRQPFVDYSSGVANPANMLSALGQGWGSPDFGFGGITPPPVTIHEYIVTYRRRRR